MEYKPTESTIHYPEGHQAGPTRPYRTLWAKADRYNKASFHRLIYHLMDVGISAEALWRHALHPALKLKVADWLRLNEADTGSLIAFLAALHDLGKASPAFQDHPYLHQPLKKRLIGEINAAGLPLPCHHVGENHARHEIITTWALRSQQGESLLKDITNWDTSFAEQIAQMLGGHHGLWPGPHLFGPTVLTAADKGGTEWGCVRADLVKEMAQLFQPPFIATYDAEATRDNVMLALLSGIVSIADWIGSDFPHVSEHLSLNAYVQQARHHAGKALNSLAWTPPEEMPIFEFERVFPFSPSVAQNEISSTLASVELPALAIIEAPMGAGKTEAALAVFADWSRRMGQGGLYMAMPTTATSNEMHERTASFLTSQLGHKIKPLLIHGRALLRKTPKPNDPVEEEQGTTAAAQSWFLPRKKSLLVPYGVGTVDQAFMSVLQTKHFFVRLLGLSHKVVIFDEVHAYDVYMSELFDRLLVWLRAIDASVIILSATLPEKTRQRLVSAYAGGSKSPSTPTYPRLTFIAKDRLDAVPLSPPPTRTLYYDWLPREDGAIIAKLREMLASEEGGCAAVICNTVKRAQDLFLALSELRKQGQGLCADDNLILFHARFPLAWREEIEEKVRSRFGPGPNKKARNPQRPTRAIVVATQVIEQSLDLDFDIMISDCAPMDLLLQRAGRLQRHVINNPRRHPDCLWIAEPPTVEGLPQFEKAETKYIYDEYILLRTWLILKAESKGIIRIPGKNGELASLIESVYGDGPAPADKQTQAVLEVFKAEMRRKQFDETRKAQNRLVSGPKGMNFLTRTGHPLDEDNPALHEVFQALTRSDRPGLNVVCLHRINGQLYLEPDATYPYDPSVKPADQSVVELARRAVSIRRPDAMHALLGDPIDEHAKTALTRWRKISALRYHRVAIFDDGIYLLPGTKLQLELNKNEQLGLQIKETQ